MNLIARDYQLESVDSAWKQLQSNRSTLVVLPTGTGKTLVFVKLAERWFKKKKQRVVVVCPSRELVAVAEKCFRENTKLPVGVEMGERRSNGEPIVLATMQSLARRLGKHDSKDIGLIVFDEADLALAPSYEKIAGYFDDAKVFGCTATPERADGKPLAKVFETLAFKRDIVESIDAGHIVPFRRRRIEIAKVHRDRSVDDSLRVKMRGGDFDPSWLDSIFTQEKSLHEVVKPTHELAVGRQTIVFGTSVLHAQLLAALFNRYWPGSARAISGKSKDRKEILESFRRREFQFLCNCVLINRGVDLPSVSCVAMARPTLSRTLYLQMLGRGSRLADGKDDCLVVDFTFNSDVHSLTVIDALANTSEEAVRAEEIISEGGNDESVSDAVAQASSELAQDERLRDRVRAIVEHRDRGVSGIDWDLMDWANKTNKQISQEIGISNGTVGKYRPSGIPSPSKYTGLHDWSSVDWRNKSDTQIAREFNLSISAVGRHRPAGILSPRGNRYRTNINWNSIDWENKTNRQISSETGVGEVAVSRRRPRSVPSPSRFTTRTDIDWSRVDWKNKTNAQISRELRSSERTVSLNRPVDIVTPRFVFPCNASIDWHNKSDAQIGRELGIKSCTVAAHRPSDIPSPYRTKKNSP